MKKIKANKEETIDLMYIELSDMERSLQESSLNCKKMGTKISKTIREIRTILSHKKDS